MGDMDSDKMNEIFIEAESFAFKGGWATDSQSYETLGSAYLMAHGLGKPVADATTTIKADNAGEYFVWARTRDWTAAWDKSAKAGRFKVGVDGVLLRNETGIGGEEWAWEFAGKIALEKGVHELRLHDLTGFDGRCDCLYLTTDNRSPDRLYDNIAAMREKFAPPVKVVDEKYDLIVVGGGIAGICLAYSAMKSGVKTLLLHDRPMLGGCNSTEVRVCMGGMRNLPPYEQIGNVVRAIEPLFGSSERYDARFYEDDRKLNLFTEINGEKYIKLNQRVTGIEKDGDRITAVKSVNIPTGERFVYTATLFADCSGDAVLARLGGAEVFYGREAQSKYDESLAPETAQKLVMGHSLRWYSEKTQTESSFPDISWGFDFDENSYMNCTAGDWEQETGFTRDMVKDIEYIRDYGLRAIYSNWAYQKNRCKDKEKFANYELKWISPVGGKRESYRVKGDLVLNQNDIENRVLYPDGTACLTWSIDIHYPEPTNAEKFGEAFRSCAYHRGIGKPYPVPYRCLYSADISNLFLGGRIISLSRIAFSSARVMRTLGQLGEVAGIAAGVCVKNNCTPREVYTEFWDETRALLTAGVQVPASFNGGINSRESYHFKDLGWITFADGDEIKKDILDFPERRDEYESRIKKLGVKMKNR